MTSSKSSVKSGKFSFASICSSSLWNILQTNTKSIKNFTAKQFNFFLFYIFQSLPAPVKRRLKALKKIQLESTKIEAKFYEEVHKLECKYHEMYLPLYEKRSKVTKGKFKFMKYSYSKVPFDTDYS